MSIDNQEPTPSDAAKQRAAAIATELAEFGVHIASAEILKSTKNKSVNPDGN